MRTATWGPTDFEVSVIGQGTWNIETYDKTEAIRAIRHGIDLGMNHIDTAYDYGMGASEAFLGEALKGVRDQVFLVSKVLPQVADYEGTLKACEYSLQRLQTDRLDCLLLHWREDKPLQDTIRAFEKLQQDGKIRSYGMSNLDVHELQEAIDIAGPGRIACNQVIYNFQFRDVEKRMIPFCREHGIAMVGYAPYGDVRAEGNLFDETLRIGGGTIEAIAEAHGVSTRNVTAAFLLRTGAFVIPKGERVEFAQDNARASDVQLTADEIARLEAVFPLPEDRPIPFTTAYYE
jgi:diketogulonate reductase-like aldo/keto reductase